LKLPFKSTVEQQCFFDHSASAPTASFSGGLPREPTHETENVFRAEKAFTRYVATRQPARDVARGFANVLD